MADNVIVVNVLSKDTFDDCRIKGSINVPFDDLGEYAQNIDQNQKIVVYCASYSCPVSRKAWHLLHDMHFKRVYAYEGGIAEWRQKGFPTEGECLMDYLEQAHEKPEGDGRLREISAEDLKKLMSEEG